MSQCPGCRESPGGPDPTEPGDPGESRAGPGWGGGVGRRGRDAADGDEDHPLTGEDGVKTIPNNIVQ